jgi:TsgA-like MFS transporter
MINQYRITLVSFLAYFIMSGMLSPIGIVSGPMAEYFDLPVTEITNKFSWLTLGILIGSGFALVAFDVLTIKILMLIVYGVLSVSLFSMLVSPSLDIVGLALGAIGVGCGIDLAGAATIISSTYDENSRASMLVITDGCFSVAGIVVSYIAIYLIGQQFHWAGPYGFVGLIAVLVFGLSLLSKFPEYKPEVSVEQTQQSSVWPISVWLCIGGLFLYTLGQYSLLWWLPNYAETALGVEPGKAGEMVGQFWSGMFVAQIFVAWWVFKIGVKRLVIIGAIATTLGSIPLWLVTDIDHLVALAFVWGLANLGLLKIMISFGSLMIPNPPPRLISAFLFGATSGTAVSPFVTSQIVELFSNDTVLQFGTACYVLLTILVLLAGKLKPA